MPKWIAFAQESEQTLAARVPGAELAAGPGDELDALLDAAATTPAAALTRVGHDVLLITARTRDAAAREPQRPVEPVAYEATGFLGLSDEPVFGDEEERR